MRNQMITYGLLAMGISIQANAFADSAPTWTQGHHPEAFIASIQNDPKAGQKVYEQFCATCHAADPSIDLGAPRFRNTQDWRDRKQKGIEGLLTVTTVGLNQMPPRGGCFECSDKLLKAAIIYMLPPSKKPVKNQ